MIYYIHVHQKHYTCHMNYIKYQYICRCLILYVFIYYISHHTCKRNEDSHFTFIKQQYEILKYILYMLHTLHVHYIHYTRYLDYISIYSLYIYIYIQCRCSRLYAFGVYRLLESMISAQAIDGSRKELPALVYLYNGLFSIYIYIIQL